MRRSRSLSLVHQPTDARTRPVLRNIPNHHACRSEPCHHVGRGLFLRTPRDDGRALIRGDDVLACLHEQLPAAFGHLGTTLEAPLGAKPNRGQEPAHQRGGYPVGVETASSRPRLECAVWLVRPLREVARSRDPQPFGIGDDEGSGRLRSTEPLLTRNRQEVETDGFDWDRAHGLRSIDQDWDSRPLAELADRQHLPRRPEDVREGEQTCPRRDRRLDRFRVRRDDHRPRSGCVQRADQPEVLVRGRDHLVAGAETQPREDDVAAVRRGRGQRDLVRLRADEVGKLGAQLGSKGEDALDVLDPHPALAQVPPLLGAHRLGRPASKRPRASRLQIGDLLEHRKLGACLLEGHARESTVRIHARSARGSTCVYTSV